MLLHTLCCQGPGKWEYPNKLVTLIASCRNCQPTDRYKAETCQGLTGGITTVTPARVVVLCLGLSPPCPPQDLQLLLCPLPQQACPDRSDAHRYV